MRLQDHFSPLALAHGAAMGEGWHTFELRLFLVLIIWNFELQKCPEELSGYAAVDKLTHAPQQCFVRLKKIVDK